MPTRFFRSTVAAAAVGAGSLCFLGSPAGAQNPCYPPTPGCVIPPPTSVGTTGPSITLSATTVARPARTAWTLPPCSVA